MIKVFAGNLRARVLADGKPYLRLISLLQIVRSARSTPFLVRNHPGSRAFEKTAGHSRTIANARITSCSLLWEYACCPRHGRSFQAKSFRLASPLWCSPELRYTSRFGL